MTPRYHQTNRVLAVLAVVLSIALGVVIGLTKPWDQLSHRDVATTSENVLKNTAVRANVAAQSTAVPGCNPAPGAGKLGACAPVEAQAAVAAIAKAAGDPAVITGRPLGVDVSSYQRCLTASDFAHLSFAFAKASEGTGYTDAHLRCNVQAAKAAHKPYGVYHFLRPSPFHSATAEARHFVTAVSAAAANTSLPPVADVEVNAGLSPSALSRYVCTFHRVVAGDLHRSFNITYTGNWFWGPQVGGSRCGTVLWVSAYAFAPIVPKPWSRYTFWQYSDGTYGPTPHINHWDSDTFAGTPQQLQALARRRPPLTHHQRYLQRLRAEHAKVHARIARDCHGRRAHIKGHRAECRRLRARNRTLHRHI